MPLLPTPGTPIVVHSSGGDDTTRLQAAITAAAARAHREIFLPSAAYTVSSGLTNTTRSIRLVGGGQERTVITYTGTGAFWTQGSDNGLARDRADYDGVQELTLERIALKTSGGVTALSCGAGNYKSGTYAIRDWRGGKIKLYDVYFEGWDYWFWGVQSDINWFERIYATKNHNGAYFGPRSDQATIQGVWSSFNDQVFWFDRCTGARIRDWQTDADGSGSMSPCRIGGQDSWATAPLRGASDIVFDSCWFEHQTPGGAASVDAFISVGVGDTSVSSTKPPSTDIRILNPTVLPGDVGYLTKTLIKTEYATSVSVEHPGPPDKLSLLDAIFAHDGTFSPRMRLDLQRTVGQSGSYGGTVKVMSNASTGVPEVFIVTDVNQNLTLNVGAGTDALGYRLMTGNSSFTLRSNNGRLYLLRSTANNERDMYIGGEGDGEFNVVMPNSATGNTDRLRIKRRITYNTAAPATGTWAVGDRCWNQAPAVGNPIGWICTVAGSPGTWVAMANL